MDKKSPLNVVDPNLAMAAVKGGAGMYKGIFSNVKDSIMEAKEDGKIGFKDALKIYGSGLKGALGGFAQGILGDSFGLVKNPEEKRLKRQIKKQKERARLIEENAASMEKYQDDIDIAGQTLSSPLSKKNLTSVGLSYTPLKMKAKQMEQSALMMVVSGSSTLPVKNK